MPTNPGAAMLGEKVFITRTSEPFRNAYERWWDGEEWLWVDHGRPASVQVTGSPGAAMGNEKYFVIVSDGSLWERHWRADLERWTWVEHGRPDNRRLVHGPGAAMMDQKLFVVDEDGAVWERHWRPDLARWAWFAHGRPENRKIVTAPGAAMLNRKFFVVDEDGALWERDWRQDLGRWAWQSHGRPENRRIGYAPGAAMLNEKLFVVTEGGDLFERHWRVDLGRWAWQDHGRPRQGLAGAPGAEMGNSRLFVRGADGRLYERGWSGRAWGWIDHGAPPGTRLETDPGGAMLDTKLFVGTQNQRMFERYHDGSQWVWVDHGTLLHDTRVTVITSPRPRKVIAVVGDGFDESNLESYREFVRDEIDRGVFDRDLFGELRGRFTVHRVDLVSIAGQASTRRYDDQGTPNDPSDDTVVSEDLRNTRLGTISTGSWAHCWIAESTDTDARLRKVLRRFVPDFDYAVVVVNDSQWGGCRRSWKQYITRGVNWAVVYHEFGHQVGDLADEYSRSGRVFNGTAYARPNCSVTAVRADIPWADLIAGGTPLPSDSGSLPSGWDDNRSVGAFQGCGTFESGLFRPVLSCRMNTNQPPFCPVCERVLREVLA